MGLNVTTDDKGIVVYVKDKTASSGTPFKTYSGRLSEKKQDNTWISTFIDLVFPKKVDVSKVTNKCTINIKKSFVLLNEYNGNVYKKIMVLDFDVIKDGELPSVNGDEDFMQISDTEADSLPFK